MSTQNPATVPIAPALADLAFASATDSQVSRSLAWTAPGDLGIDLNDPEQRRFGEYELLELIGQGGMGAVYRARQHNLDREVALKFLAAGPWASDEFIARFRREAQAAARMQHPNIVEIYDTGVRDGLYFFSMRLVKGETLADRLRAKGPMDVKRSATMMRTMAEAIDYAHRLGVLHLDLKPGNVLLDTNDEPLVADFGLARRIDEGPSEHENISGTPSYMAPEQATSRASNIGPAADIYGLGAILYEMLVGEPPFRGRDVKDTLSHVLNDVPTPPRSRRHDIPADLNAICLKCLAKDPQKRYDSARELADELRRFLDGDSVAARAPNGFERLRRWVARNQWQTVAYIVFAGGLVISTNEMRAAMQARLAAEDNRVRAEQQTVRSEQMTALMAQAFPVPTDSESGEPMEHSAKRIINWLDREFARDQKTQSEVLVELIEALEGADNPHAAQALIWPIIEILGRDYRSQVAEAHLRSDSHRGKLLGTILLNPTEDDPVAATRKDQLLTELVEAAPDDLDTLAAATIQCPAGHPLCDQLHPAKRLAALQPDNGANWAYVLREQDDLVTVADLVHRAATAPSFDDQFTRVFRLGQETLASSPVEIPIILRSAIEHFNQTVSVEETVAWYQSWSLPLPNWNRLVTSCRADGLAARDAQFREDCLRIAKRAAYAKQSILTSMIGSTIIRHLKPGTEDATRARELRREYTYTFDALNARTPAQLRASRDELRAREVFQVGEMEASKRSLDRAGIPRDPPADWEPEDPSRLMTALERGIYQTRRSELARQPMLVPIDPEPQR